MTSIWALKYSAAWMPFSTPMETSMLRPPASSVAFRMGTRARGTSVVCCAMMRAFFSSLPMLFRWLLMKVFWPLHSRPSRSGARGCLQTRERVARGQEDHAQYLASDLCSV